MKKTLLMLMLAAAFGPAQAADKIRAAGNFAIEHSSSKAMELFKAELAKASGGRLEVDLFPAMQLGGAKENVDGVRAGTIFMTWVGTAFLSGVAPELEAVSLPFAFKDRDAALRTVDGKVGKLLDEKLAQKGFVSLGWMELGSRHATNSKRPLKSLDDFKGLKIRMQPNETHLATFRALGANPVAMDVKELYSALQQGVVDGQENPYSVILANRYFEVQKYVSDTGHFFDFINIVANKRQFDGLQPDYQKAIRGAMATAVASQRKSAREGDAAALAELRKHGMQFDAVSPQLREAMRKATAGVVDSVKKRAGAPLVEAVLKEAM